MSKWPSVKAAKVYRALLKIGWVPQPRTGTSHIKLQRGQSTYIWAFQDHDELGSKMLSRIAKHTGLTPEDL